MGIKEQIREYILENHFTIDDQKDLWYDTDLVNSGILDSFAVVDIVHFIERTYGIVIDAEDFVPEHFSTLEAVEQFILKKQKA